MAHPILNGSSIAQRYETRRPQYMTLLVTRQHQSFSTIASQQLCDIELINASVQLVGEPGIGNVGVLNSSTTPHKSTMNSLHAVNDAGTTSTVYGLSAENRIIQKTHLDHGYLNIGIKGMTMNHHFRQDTIHAGNGNIQLFIPTDLGLLEKRDVTWPINPIKLEAVHLQQSIKVTSIFSGTWPDMKKYARFTEDWADTAGGTKRNVDGTVRYFVNDDEGQASAQECQVPANCIDSIKLVFKITPRVDV
jgi:hypothetical protein